MNWIPYVEQAFGILIAAHAFSSAEPHFILHKTTVDGQRILGLVKEHIATCCETHGMRFRTIRSTKNRVTFLNVHGKESEEQKNLNSLFDTHPHFFSTVTVLSPVPKKVQSGHLWIVNADWINPEVINAWCPQSSAITYGFTNSLAVKLIESRFRGISVLIYASTKNDKERLVKLSTDMSVFSTLEPSLLIWVRQAIEGIQPFAFYFDVPPTKEE